MLPLLQTVARALLYKKQGGTFSSVVSLLPLLLLLIIIIMVDVLGNHIMLYCGLTLRQLFRGFIVIIQGILLEEFRLLVQVLMGL